jgi:diguanylate cyclase (GGDEF)-like protein
MKTSNLSTVPHRDSRPPRSTDRTGSIPSGSSLRQPFRAVKPGDPNSSLVRARSHSAEVPRASGWRQKPAADAHGISAAGAASVSAHAEPVLADPAPPRRATRPDHLDRVMPLLVLASAASQWFVHTQLALVLLALTPLLLIALERGRPKAYIYAGLTSVAFCAVDLGRPLQLAGTALLVAEPHRIVSLLTVALVMFQLSRAYFGLQELSRRDPLTGLLNRRGFEELAARELERGARYARPIAFALIDIDRFKEVNDHFGHAFGDRVLRSVGAQLGNLRVSDLAVRLGGDEFGLLMPETDQAAAESVVARLQERVHERMATAGWTVTISVGIAVASADNARPLAALIAEADRRMYANKPHRHAQAKH